MKILFEEDEDLKEFEDLNNELSKSESESESDPGSDKPLDTNQRDYDGDIDAELAKLGFGGEDQKDQNTDDLGDLGGDNPDDLDLGDDLGDLGDLGGENPDDLDDLGDLGDMDDAGGDELNLGGGGLGGGLGGFDVGMDDDGVEADNAGGEDLPLPKPVEPEKPTWEPVELKNKKDFSVKRTDGFSLRARKIPSLPNTWIAQLYTKDKELSKGWVTIPKGHEPEEYITALANTMLDKNSYRYQQSGIKDEDTGEDEYYGEEDLENPNKKEFGEEQKQEPEEESPVEGFDLEHDLGE